MHAGSHWVETISTMGGGDSVVCASVIIHISRVRMLPCLRMLSNYLLSERTKNSPSVGWGRGAIHMFESFNLCKTKFTKTFIKLGRKDPIVS